MLNKQISPITADDRKKLFVILLFILFQWTIYLQIGFDSQTGIRSFPNPDTMCTLSVARSLAHGHPLQIIPGDPPSTILSDLISPFLVLPGYWLGFKSLSAFVLWVYIEFLFVAFFSAFFIYRFFKKSFPEVAFVGTFLVMAFHGLFSNIFSTNFGFFILFFWGALAYLESFPLFMIFSIIAGLLRPEGAVTYLVLGYLYYVSNNKKIPWIYLTGYIPIAVPFIIYFYITGNIVPQGILPQNILHYHGWLESIRLAFSVITDQIKGVLLGLYPTGFKIGADNAAWMGALPPFLFPLAILGLWKSKKNWLIPVMLYLFFLIAGDAFTIYAGAHQNRHIHLLTPLFFGFALYYVTSLKTNKNLIFNSVVILFFSLASLQFYSALFDKKSNVEKLTRNKQMMDYIYEEWPEKHILVQNMGPLYWTDGRQKIHILFESVDPYLGRYVKYHNRPLEVAEYIQKSYPYKVLFIDYQGQSPLTEWLLQFNEKSLKTFMLKYFKYAEVKELNLEKIHDKPPYKEDYYDELDIGDLLSEKEHHYRHVQSLERPVGGFLLEGDNFWDGGRPYVVSEEFEITVPKGGGVLVCRYKGAFYGNILEGDNTSRVNLMINESQIKIFSNGSLIYSEHVPFDKGFSYIEVPLENEGVNNVKVEGLMNSFHYWVYGTQSSALSFK